MEAALAAVAVVAAITTVRRRNTVAISVVTHVRTRTLHRFVPSTKLETGPALAQAPSTVDPSKHAGFQNMGLDKIASRDPCLR